MEHKHDIFDKMAGRNAGMTVPEDFFATFNARMADSLPKQPWENQAGQPKPVILPRTRWQRIRPYVYLAAMFMGIWCMMKMFDMMKPASQPPIANNPVLMSAIDNDAFYYDYCIPDISDDELYDELYDQGFDPSSIEE